MSKIETKFQCKTYSIELHRQLHSDYSFSRCPLTRAVIGQKLEQLWLDVQSEFNYNLSLTLAAARFLGIRYLFVSHSELRSNNHRAKGWPAVWAISDIIQLKTGAGNPNQKQLMYRRFGVYEFDSAVFDLDRLVESYDYPNDSDHCNLPRLERKPSITVDRELVLELEQQIAAVMRKLK